MEEMVAEIVSEMDYLRTREQKLRDTNESTNNRVKYFGLSTTFLLVGLWVWQVLYLRAYFRWVLPHNRPRVVVLNIADHMCAPGPSILSKTGRDDEMHWGDQSDGHSDMMDSLRISGVHEMRSWLSGYAVELGFWGLPRICIHLGRQKHYITMIWTYHTGVWSWTHCSDTLNLG